jgi:thymidylate synthase
MSKADVIYNELVREISTHGTWDKGENVRTKYADGTPAYTKSIIGKQVTFESDELPLITTKQVAWRSAIAEIWWIWLMRSNKVEDLRQLGSKVWNEWELEDGTIGKAYAYQVAKKVRSDKIFNVFDHKYDQFDYLIKQLQTNKSSRRLITSLWNIDDLDEMALEPCVWSQQWIVQGGTLNLIVNQRSADVALGVVFNWFQYRVLHEIISNLTGFKLGKMVWNFGHLHYYDRHESTLLHQIEGETHEQPKLIIPEGVELGYHIYSKPVTKDDLHRMFNLEGYKNNGKFTYEVAI